MNRISTLLWTLAAFVMTVEMSFAQNTGGIFAPVVNDNHRSFQYRSALDPNNASGEVGFAQRLHYEQSINGDLMWRVIGQLKKTDASDLDFDFVQGELYWQITPDNKVYETGLRFDANIKNQGRSSRLGVNWSNQWDLGEGWDVRAIAFSAINISNSSDDGVFLQARTHFAKSIGGGKSIGLESFSNFGSTSNFGSFKTQGHSVGPYITVPVGHKFSIYAGTLFGVSEAAVDNEFRLWLTKKL